jgi:catechol 2,3-dioxygenase-like lactoylglutathione lyase family enzyme
VVSSLTAFPIHATVAVTDIARAKAWFHEKLGCDPKITDPGGIWYEFGSSSWLLVYPTDAAGTAQNTVAGWSVEGIEHVMAELRGRGVVFEEYDLPDFKTVDGLATFGTFAKSAWFKDDDGNTYELSEVFRT